MRLAVLASAESWYLADLRRAAGCRHEILQVTFRDLVSHLGLGDGRIASGPVDLRGVDCLLVRAMPPGSLEQVVFRMDVLGRLEAAGTRVVNPARAVEAAVDKYLASARLEAAGLRVPKTIVCQTLDEAMTAFDALGRDVVIKPLFGSEGRGILRVSDDEGLAYQAFTTLVRLQAVLYLQEFIPHRGFDLRLLVVGEQVLGISRHHASDWRTNVARGAVPQPLTPSKEMLEQARRAAAAIGAPLAGVDLLPSRNGELYALEVNAVPGWKALAATLDVDVAALLLRWLFPTQ